MNDTSISTQPTLSSSSSSITGNVASSSPSLSGTSSFGSSPSSSSLTGTSSFESSPSSSSLSGTSSGSDDGFFGSSFVIWLLLGALVVIISINGISYYMTGKMLFGEEVFNAVTSVTSGISTFFNNLMNSTEMGGKGAVEVAGETVKSAASIPDKVVKGSQVSQNTSNKINQTSATNAGDVEDSDDKPQNKLETKINKTNMKTAQDTEPDTRSTQEVDYSGPEPNETKSKSTSESSIGYCYIGEYDGTRSCASINESTKCMSGDIFDTKQKCMAINNE
jgi:hypothetical protein|uniref:Uncharacterized protein n=1 Tax=viral metagenome TaxID=1070528 RepID=A0A6C0IP79_9ZZZZ